MDKCLFKGLHWQLSPPFDFNTKFSSFGSTILLQMVLFFIIPVDYSTMRSQFSYPSRLRSTTVPFWPCWLLLSLPSVLKAMPKDSPDSFLWISSLRIKPHILSLILTRQLFTTVTFVLQLLGREDKKIKAFAYRQIWFPPNSMIMLNLLM